MSKTTISSTTGTAVALTSVSQSYVTITARGTINTSGAYAVYASIGTRGTIINYGRLSAPRGEAIRLTTGGSVTNGSAGHGAATILGGAYGIEIDARGTGTVTNFGTISGSTARGSNGIGIAMDGSGAIINGSTADTLASITGDLSGIRVLGAGVSIGNYGTIKAFGSIAYAVYMRTGGTVTNGSVVDRAALITGYELGVHITTMSGTVTNYGTIEGTSTTTSFGRAVQLSAGGTIVNGSTADTTALLYGVGTGVYIKGPSNNGSRGYSSSKVINFATITGAGGGGIYMRLSRGAVVTNGSGTDTRALIRGAANGIRIQDFTPTTVTNFGTIAGGSAAGIYLTGGGTITNGSVTVRSATIQGAKGIHCEGSTPSTVVNYGTVSVVPGGNGQAILLAVGGNVTNGSAADAAATIAGVNAGVRSALGDGTVTNYGTIRGGVGVDFNRVVSGAVTLAGHGTVFNAGLIASTSGATGTAVQFGSGSEKLVMMPSAGFVGRVVGGSGQNRLELASGSSVGTVSGLGTSFTNFGTVNIDQGGRWNMTGTNSLAAGGSVTVGAGATLTVNGRLSAVGVTLTGGGDMLALASPRDLSATIVGFGAGDTIDLIGTVATSLSFANGGLIIGGNSGAIATLRFQGAFSRANFAMAPDGRSGTKITSLGLAGAATPAAAPIATVIPDSAATFIAALRSILTPASGATPQAATTVPHGYGGVGKDLFTSSHPQWAW